MAPDESMYIKGRKYLAVDHTDPQAGDVVRWLDACGQHTNKVIRVSKTKQATTVHVARHAHEGDKPIRVSLLSVVKCWRWHRNVTDDQTEKMLGASA